jgi:hypothetical protein
MKKLGDLIYKYDRMERDDDSKIAAGMNRVIEELSDRRTIYRVLIFLGICNVLLWIAVVIFPSNIRNLFETVIGASDKIGMALLGIPFGLGLYLTYSVFRLKFPDVEEQNIESAPMGSYGYHAHSNRRWMVWVFSVVGGILNVLFLILVDIGLSGG